MEPTNHTSSLNVRRYVNSGAIQCVRVSLNIIYADCYEFLKEVMPTTLKDEQELCPYFTVVELNV